MRVYASQDTAVIVFRPTQQTPQGGDIYVDRHVSPADFLQHKTNQVRVPYRFQQAYLEMVHSCRSILCHRVEMYVLGVKPVVERRPGIFGMGKHLSRPNTSYCQGFLRRSLTNLHNTP